MLTQDYNSQRNLQHIAILVPAVAKSCKPRLKETNEKKASREQCIYVMLPIGRTPHILNVGNNIRTNAKRMEKKLKQSILTSYLIGAPIGILTIIATIWIPLLLTGEGLLTIVILGTYGISTIGLVVAFLIALWIGGKLAYQNIKNGKSLLLTSFKYSIVVNLIIWTTFCVIIGLTVTEERFLMMIPPIIAFVVCTVLTTFSIGLIISYVIKRINNKPTVFNSSITTNQ
jgi:hypothetical protein